MAKKKRTVHLTEEAKVATWVPELGVVSTSTTTANFIPSVISSTDWVLCPDVCGLYHLTYEECENCGCPYEEHEGHGCPSCGYIECFTNLGVSSDGRVQRPKPPCDCPSCKAGYTVNAQFIIGSKVLRVNRAAAGFGLDDTLLLAHAAADFYLMMEMVLSGAVGIEQRLKKHTEHLAEQLCRYLEMASLGELRHLGEHESYSSFPLHILELHRELRMNHSGGQDWRMAVWGAWSELYQEYGTKLHEMISEAFRTKGWPGGYGGKKWAVCIEVALHYRRGEFPNPTVFVDQAFGLEHNGSIAYSKFWIIEGLKGVLEIARNAKGKTPPEYLEHYCSPEMREIHENWREEREKVRTNGNGKEA